LTERLVAARFDPAVGLPDGKRFRSWALTVVAISLALVAGLFLATSIAWLGSQNLSVPVAVNTAVNTNNSIPNTHQQYRISAGHSHGPPTSVNALCCGEQTYYLLAGATPVLVHNSGGDPLPPLIIGENVLRTQTYAAAYGEIAWTPRNPGDTAIPGVYEDLMRRNMRAIDDAMREGRMIIDIGPHFERMARTGQTSPFYEAERRAIQERDYGTYAKDFERTGKLQGGSSRLGEVC